MSTECQIPAPRFDTSLQRRALSTRVQSCDVLAATPLDLQSALFKSAVETSDTALAICACAESLVIIYANLAFCALTGCRVDDLYGRRYDFMVLADSSQADRLLLNQAIAADQSATATVRCRIQRDGTELTAALRVSPLRNAAGATTHYLIALREIDEAQCRIEQLRFLAHHDTLTGLPNRRLLLDRLDCALARYERYGEGFGVAFADVDRFKEINDVLGHAAGDVLLKQVARCLTLSVRASDTVGRLGGDEFVLLLSGASTTGAFHDSVVRALAAAFSEPLAVAGRAIKVSCSIGVATCPCDGTSVADLLQEADAAMYRVKRQRTSPAWAAILGKRTAPGTSRVGSLVSKMFGAT